MAVMVIGASPTRRSTKAGDYPRLRPGKGQVVAPGCPGAQRRPEITPGYDRRRRNPLDTRFQGRSTKAGDYPRLRPPKSWRRAMSGSARAQRRPEITPGYDATSPGMTSCGRSNAQRRPEITPGYDAVLTLSPLFQAGGALNEGRRLPPATTRLEASHRRAIREPLNEGRRLPPATTPPTRAGTLSLPTALNEGRRLPPATTVERRPDVGVGILRSTKAGDYPRLRPDPAPPEPPEPDGRSTKAGDYPRLRPPIINAAGSHASPTLNEGRRLPPATTGCAGRCAMRRTTPAQRRPEITPGYDKDDGWCVVGDVVAAQRRPEITPGYDGVGGMGLVPLPHRSTKAGDYPRLRRRSPASRAGCRGSLNEGRRLPPATTLAQRRRAARKSMTLNEGRRLPPATTRR